MENEDKISMTSIWFATLSCKHKGQNFLKKSYRIRSSFHQKSIEVHRTGNNVERRTVECSPFLRPVCPCVPLCGTGGVVAGQGSLEQICPDFGQRKKEGIGNQYLPKGTLTDAKNDCRWKPAIKWAGVSSNRPQCGDFLALRADIKIRRLTSIKTFFSEEINQKP